MEFLANSFDGLAWIQKKNGINTGNSKRLPFDIIPFKKCFSLGCSTPALFSHEAQCINEIFLSLTNFMTRIFFLVCDIVCIGHSESVLHSPTIPLPPPSLSYFTSSPDQHWNVVRPFCFARKHKSETNNHWVTSWVNDLCLSLFRIQKFRFFLTRYLCFLL